MGEGKRVWCWRYSYEEEPKPRSFWENRLRRWRVGDTVTAWVNPAEPKDSLIEKKRDAGLFRLAVKTALGMGFFLAGAVMAALPLWGWGKKRVKKGKGARAWGGTVFPSACLRASRDR